MQAFIQASSISGIIQAPASKSSMQRACAAALIKGGITVLHNPGVSDDDKAALDIIGQLGAIVDNDSDTVVIRSSGQIDPKGPVINCGESGLSARMFTPIAALNDTSLTITGHGSLVKRPLSFFNEVLPRLGVEVSSNKGFLPLVVKGPLQPKDIEIDGSLSSQFLTGLLFAYSAANASKVTITVNNLNSKPYIDLTQRVMTSFGLHTPVNSGYKEFHFTGISPVQARHSKLTYTVEGDWSGSAFLLVAGAIGGEIRVNELFNTSVQADKKIVDALLDAGAEVEVSDKFVHVKRKNLESFEFNATDCPDLFPPLVALAANCSGITRIRGLQRLKHKESDRGATLKEEFEKLGTRIDLLGDEMLVYGNGGVSISNQKLNSHHDHRIAMAIAIACIHSGLEVQIRNAEAVNKSYPAFWQDLQKLGVAVSLTI